MNLKITGLGVSPGVAIGKARVLRKTKTALRGKVLSTDAEIEQELANYEQAVTGSLREINAIRNENTNLSAEASDILETQVELLNDPQLRGDVTERIGTGRMTAHDAVLEAIAALVQVFRQMDDEYMRARSADIEDIGNRLMRQLSPGTAESMAHIELDTVLFAEDIAPSDALTFTADTISAIVTRMGGKTSHTAILARSKGIPAIVGCVMEPGQVADDDLVIADGSEGLVIIRPDEATIAMYNRKKARENDQFKLKSLKDIPAVTRDGKLVKLLANISGPDELEIVTANGGEGIGLLRTEMLFLGHDSFPTEEMQFEFYKKTALKLASRTLIIRTLDIGGDKQLPYLPLPAEENPFLGYRAIRICLDREDLFITQLKAILRASVYGNLKIMFPMISSLQELRQAKAMVEKAKHELAASNLTYNAGIEIGMMIEIPAAAVMADLFAREVDFFSIGTNDLCQYTVAADRMNQQVEKVYDPYNPGVLRLLRNTIEQANLHEIHVGMCGEMASDPMATLLLLGMGLREFSMSASAIPGIKHILINNSMAKAREITENVMKMDNSATIIRYLKEEGQ
ncbi:phosphoenolpyruvate--protein phosphotransferase [Hufsiella ginkgonis]|uniref:Phosphoenolpyruvate-protein phosphotransferase n=1 Tax=Hufsiella ginkgonis TaxID=2695274 RepID=A0A7K1Y191_9SPHI|nr:phosphoenolpyruvate--protein phosphotransferase [Hufsiella ginkgonis]MXV16446.1 phosphoenolpyruvate--protein phosphotransferase [Hufsiella ginkgonis]